MNRGRVFAHIFEVNSLEVKAYLLPGTDSLVQSHAEGISRIARIGSFAIIESAGSRLVGVVRSLQVTDPEKLFWLQTRSDLDEHQIIRIASIALIGQLVMLRNGTTRFERGITVYPSIDEKVLAPRQDDLDAILNEDLDPRSPLVLIGSAFPSLDTQVKLDPGRLFSRHCGLFGSTGNGKSCTVTTIVNSVLEAKVPLDVFVVDVNGEYAKAWEGRTDKSLKIVKIAGNIDSGYDREGKEVVEDVKLNYMSFSRNTFRTILKPSEKTQVPALNFAYDSLKYLPLSRSELALTTVEEKWLPDHLSQHPDAPLQSFIIGDPAETDQAKIEKAYWTLKFLQIITARGIKTTATKEIAMSRLAATICDRWSITSSNRGFGYDAWRYQNVASLCDRITELCRDNLFQMFCDTSGQNGAALSELCNRTCGSGNNVWDAKIVVLDLSVVPQEYLPVVVDALLEQQLSLALKRGFIKRPRLLVLDEAHHYLAARDRSDGGG